MKGKEDRNPRKAFHWGEKKISFAPRRGHFRRKKGEGMDIDLLWLKICVRWFNTAIMRRTPDDLDRSKHPLIRPPLPSKKTRLSEGEKGTRFSGESTQLAPSLGSSHACKTQKSLSLPEEKRGREWPIKKKDSSFAKGTDGRWGEYRLSAGNHSAIGKNGDQEKKRKVE